jgi:hypothetical protein
MTTMNAQSDTQADNIVTTYDILAKALRAAQDAPLDSAEYQSWPTHFRAWTSYYAEHIDILGQLGSY